MSKDRFVVLVGGVLTFLHVGRLDDTRRASQVERCEQANRTTRANQRFALRLRLTDADVFARSSKSPEVRAYQQTVKPRIRQALKRACNVDCERDVK